MTDDDIERTIAPFVDTRFYYETYADVRESGEDAVAHYNRNGWNEGRDPNSWFCTMEYLRLHRDVAIARVNPLWHFVTAGRVEGRPLHLPRKKQKEDSKLDRAVAAKFFDAAYYAGRAGYSFESDREALDHFLDSGDRGLIDPSPHFEAEYYFLNVMNTPRVEESPLGHFIRKGRKEGALPNPMLGAKLEAIGASMPADERTKGWLIQRKPDLLGNEALLEAMEDLLIDNPASVIVSISQDDYLENVGGIQLCLAEEQRQAELADINYIHLAPLQSLLTMDEEADPQRVAYRISLNGTKLGTASAAEILTALAALRTTLKTRWILALHHLLGHSEAVIGAIAEQLKFDATYFWLHDRFFACEQYNLLRNDFDFCAAPPLKSTACELCTYGARRADHLRRMGRVFSKLKPHVLAPSASIAEIWQKSSTLAHSGLTIVPHARPKFTGRVLSYSHGDGAAENRRLRIAYVGFPAYHKGWHVFEMLAWAFSDDPRYEFVHLGQNPHPGCRLPYFVANATAQNRDATIVAIKKAAVDVVVIWPELPETFSVVTGEAIAAGAFVITHPRSGNAVALAKEHNRAFEFESVNALISGMSVDDLYRRVLKESAEGVQSGDLDFSQGMTVAFDQKLIGAPAPAPKKQGKTGKSDEDRRTTSENRASRAQPEPRGKAALKGSRS